MRAITKGAEPPSLIVHRQMAHCNYENYADKDGLRHALVTEQRGLCCYCMSRIHDGPLSMKIEHWQCQERYRDQQLTYHNLLGACLGGTGQPPALQHCDTRKGNRDLHWNPADPAHDIDTRLRYELDGSIRAEDDAFDEELQKVLNLNLAWLKNNRKGVLDAVLGWWEHERARGPVTRARLQTERTRHANGGGPLDPYCQVAVWWLDQRLSTMRA